MNLNDDLRAFYCSMQTPDSIDRNSRKPIDPLRKRLARAFNHPDAMSRFAITH